MSLVWLSMKTAAYADLSRAAQEIRDYVLGWHAPAFRNALSG